jgi:hypothetical protein
LWRVCADALSGVATGPATVGITCASACPPGKHYAETEFAGGLPDDASGG